MKFIHSCKAVIVITLLLTVTNYNYAQKLVSSKQSRETNRQRATRNLAQVEERNVRAHMEFLASDALQGRGSGTQFELLAGQYIASQMQQYGVEPAGEEVAGAKTYIQTVNITRNAFTDAPKVHYTSNGSPVSFEHGKEIVVLRMNSASIGGQLQKIASDEKPKPGAIVFVKLREGEDTQSLMRNLQMLLSSGAGAVIVEETPQWRAQWSNLASRKISYTTISNNKASAFNIIIASKDATNALSQVADGTQIEIKGQLAQPQMQRTWNAVGKLTGIDSRLSPEVILLSAHMDHLGVRENTLGEDKIFNGADDDASGCVAVLELARVLAQGTRPKRTVYFIFFGSEEAGGYGAQYFVNNLPFPKDKLTANLEFEMIGRPDTKVSADELWLTGYERSNLGIELTKQGAKLVADPHPEENFFQRSDNYTLARQGVIAHTVSSFGLHTDYHKSSDEIRTIDFNHMTRSINSMVRPVQWLVNSAFKPVWYEGKKP
jgi:hypothetical protein